MLLPASSSSAFRRVLLGLGVLLVVGLFAVQAERLLRDPSILPADDFVEYWAAGRLNAHGQNPYDASLLRPLEREAGRDVREAVLMWNPPWTLTWVMPLGQLPPRPAQLLWFALHLAIVLACADGLWRFYGGKAGHRWVAWLLALSFAPTTYLLLSGQISGFLLLGLAGFLFAYCRGWPVLAGVLASLAAVKPHLFHLFWLALLLEGLTRRRGLIALAAGVAAGLAATAIPLLTNPHVLSQYLDAMAHPATESHVPLSAWKHPLIGYWLRITFAPDHFWVQFLPCALAFAVFPVYWWYRRASWDWGVELPRITLASLLTTCYGAWPYDLIALLIPLTQAAVWLVRSRRIGWIVAAAVGYLLLDGAAHIQKAGELFVWVTPAVIVGYLLIGWATRWGSAECGVQNASNAECGVRNAE